LLAVVVCSGWLPWAWEKLAPQHTIWSEAAFVFGLVVVWEILSLPLAWYVQFHLEERFGFNTTTPATWWSDRAKGFLLAALLGYPVLVFILFLAERAGALWWLWAWAALASLQLLLMFVGPVFILPLFNRFTSLPIGDLRQRLVDLAQRVGFPARDIQVMDGSRRSRHSNAFFTGLGRFRKIILFDTLIEQLKVEELEAVLAHEIGHYKQGHVLKFLAVSTLFQLAGFYLLSCIAVQAWFFHAFGFQPGRLAPALVLFALLSSTVLFWITPLVNYWSRRFEYAADAYAARVVGGGSALIGALRGLNKKNLSNLTPHPLYSRFYYSHPTLLEREKSLATP
jgi:STE24 endopeptidase